MLNLVKLAGVALLSPILNFTRSFSADPKYTDEIRHADIQIGKSVSKGVDAELILTPTKRSKFTLGYAYTHAYVSEVPDINSIRASDISQTLDWSFVLPARLVANAGASVPVSSNIRAAVQVNNLPNHLYYDSALGTQIMPPPPAI